MTKRRLCYDVIVAGHSAADERVRLWHVHLQVCRVRFARCRHHIFTGAYVMMSWCYGAFNLWFIGMTSNTAASWEIVLTSTYDLVIGAHAVLPASNGAGTVEQKVHDVAVHTHGVTVVGRVMT